MLKRLSSALFSHLIEKPLERLTSAVRILLIKHLGLHRYKLTSGPRWECPAFPVQIRRLVSQCPIKPDSSIRRQGPLICFFTHFSRPPDTMISCTLGDSAPTFWVQVGPVLPSFTVTVDRVISQVNILLENKPSFSALKRNTLRIYLRSQLWL